MARKPKAKPARPGSSAAPAAVPGLRAPVTLAVAARLLMLTPERVGQLVKEGWIERGAKGVTLEGAVQGYVRFLKDEERRTSKSQAASRVQEARAREIELRTAREEAQLCEVAEAIDFVDEALGVLKSDMAGVPARCTRDVDQRRKIGAEIDAVFGAAADRFQQAASALRQGGQADASDGEDDA